MELGTKLESALTKYFQDMSPSPYPAYFDPAAQVIPGEAESEIEGQYICCRTAETSDEEMPLDTGNVFWNCEVELRTPARINAPADTDPSQFEKHQAMSTVLEDAILVDNLDAALTTAAAALGSGYELTVMAVQDRRPARSQSEDGYSSGWGFRVYCCSRSFS